MSAFEDTYKTGNTLGEYQVIGRLGKGGMATVYRGRHPETQVEYALKVLERGADEEDVARFQREGEAMARVDAHPHVVRVHSAGRDGERRYLVLDLAPGGNLRERLRDEQIPPDEVARIVRDLARGLEHAHQHGVLHRDLKPANVLFDESGSARLTDFGLAKMSGSQSLTATGVVMGSPAYLAPEQALSGVVDERTDVFGLGAILFHALAGRSPHVGTTVMEVVAAAAEGIKHGPATYAPDVPPTLDRITCKAMARDPSQRYPSAAALAEALDGYLSGDPEPVDPEQRRKVRIAVAVFGALLVAVVAVGALALTQPEPRPEPTEEAAAPPPKPRSSAIPAPRSFAEQVDDLVRTDTVAALGLLKRKAREGEVEARLILADVYLHEDRAKQFGVPRDPGRAISILTQVHDGGDPVEYELSEAYNGWAKKASPDDHVLRKKRAMEWLRLGAKRGDLRCTLHYAKRQLGGLDRFRGELGVPLKDLSRAEAGLKKVIEEGDKRLRREALLVLGLHYDSQPKQADKDKARKLFERAAAEGSPDAKALLERLKAQSPSKQ